MSRKEGVGPQRSLGTTFEGISPLYKRQYVSLNFGDEKMTLKCIQLAEKVVARLRTTDRDDVGAAGLFQAVLLGRRELKTEGDINTGATVFRGNEKSSNHGPEKRDVARADHRPSDLDD